MQGTTSSPSPVPLKLLPAKDHMRHSFDSALQAAMTALHLPGSQPRRRLLSLESAIVMEDDSAQSRAGVTYASSIDPTSVQICCHSNGEKWILGMGSYGVVSTARVSSSFVNGVHLTTQWRIDIVSACTFARLGTC